jgi:predicted aspartyl protease
LSTVPFRIEQDSVVIEGTANGQPVDFVLDTGDAIGPTFTAADAQRLGLAQGQAEGVEGAGGGSSVWQTTASISLGGDTWDAEPSAVDPDLEGYSLLGLPFFLARCKFLGFDLQHQTLILA